MTLEARAPVLSQRTKVIGKAKLVAKLRNTCMGTKTRRRAKTLRRRIARSRGLPKTSSMAKTRTSVTAIQKDMTLRLRAIVSFLCSALVRMAVIAIHIRTSTKVKPAISNAVRLP